MSQAENAAATSSKLKRTYRKGRPMTDSERQLAAIARKRENHKEIKVYVKNPLKDCMVSFCTANKITQAQFLETLLEEKLKSLGYDL